jgi:anti-anti-sigma regulatory factor
VESVVCGLTDHYRHIFEITRLADFMTFFATQAEAAGGAVEPA